MNESVLQVLGDTSPPPLALVKSNAVPTELQPCTDLGNAERLVAEHGADLRFAPGIGWYAWDGKRWKRDEDGEVMRRAKRTVRSMYGAAGELEVRSDRERLTKFALQSESEGRLRAAVKLAETESAVIISPDQLDADPLLFNTADGTVELTTGELREHRREDLLTKITSVSYEPNAQSDRWDDFLADITGGESELADFLQRAVGYSLTGYTSEEVLFFAHGPTATGKSSFTEALRSCLGDYATVADFETFLKRRGDAGIRNDVARLAGARLVVSIEVDDGKALAEGLLKLLTGGDMVVARFLYAESFEFAPKFTLWLAANDRPRVNADDAAMWRRILQLPFTHVIPEADRDERVKIELRSNPDVQAAILAWAVAGCLEWQRIGLAVPAIVRDYTAEYQAENDALRDWLADCCKVEPEVWSTVAALKTSYEAWCDKNGERPVTARKLGTLLEAKGFHGEKRTEGRGRKGLSVS